MYSSWACDILLKKNDVAGQMLLVESYRTRYRAQHGHDADD